MDNELEVPPFLAEWQSLIYSKPTMPYLLHVSPEHFGEYEDYLHELWKRGRIRFAYGNIGEGQFYLYFRGVNVVGDTSLAPGDISADWKL